MPHKFLRQSKQKIKKYKLIIIILVFATSAALSTVFLFKQNVPTDSGYYDCIRPGDVNTKAMRCNYINEAEGISGGCLGFNMLRSQDVKDGIIPKKDGAATCDLPGAKERHIFDGQGNYKKTIPNNYIDSFDEEIDYEVDRL